MADYTINYDDQKFKDVESDKKAAISEMEKTYSGMINQSDGFYQAQIDASKEWEKKQTALQNEKTDFAIEQIEQQKDQAKKDYTKEQSGAYVDWQKQSNEYGVNAEQMAAQGMQNTGYSESSQVSMYNTYQNRVATAREAYNRAVLNYDNAIKDARLQNNSVLAEIAFEALQKQLELSLEGFQYKNTLVLAQADKKLELEQMYHERWQDVLDQMNTENALAEDIRQFNAQLAEEQRQFDQLHPAVTVSSGGGGYYGGGGGDGGGGSKDSPNGDASIKKTTSSNSSGGEYDSKLTNMASIVKLNQGPIGATNLASQIASGKVTASTGSNGKTNVSYANPTNSLLFSKTRF